MSNYKNYVQDFPKRCRELLKLFDRQAEKYDREVTLLLSVTTTALIVPFERLKLDHEDSERMIHPFADPNHDIAAKKLHELMAQPFCKSPLATGIEGKITGIEKRVERDPHPDAWHESPEQWEDLRNPENAITKLRTCGSILKLLRNALAHGNVFSSGRVIDRLIFLSRASEKSDKFNALALSPTDLRIILDNWINFLDGLEIPIEIDLASSAHWD